MVRTLALLLTLAALPAFADDGSDESSGAASTEELMKSINLGTGNDAAEVSYEGNLSTTAPGYASGKPLAITHTGGTIAVRCMDQPGITARLQYTIYGTNKDAMERFGKGIGFTSWGDANGGGVKTRIPAKASGISRVDIPLTVNLPHEAALTITGGSGWVQVVDCKGSVKSSNGDGGAYVSGTYKTFVVSAAKGDVKVELNDDSAVVGVNSVSAPAGSATLRLPLTYGGKFMAKASSVSVFHTVMGTNTSNLVQGTIGTGTGSVTVSAKDNVEVTAPK